MGHIQIRNVPEEVHRTLEARAAREGMSLSEYLLREVTELARRPSLAELAERIRRRPAVKLEIPVEEVIREEREARERHVAGS
jgi:plasmid stability protein